MARDMDWSQAACRQPGVDPDMWFDRPDIAPPGTGHQTSAAALVCLTECPARLRDACLRQALRDERDMPRKSRFGVFGGASPNQRYELWKRLHPERAAALEAKAERIAAGRERAGPQAA